MTASLNASVTGRRLGRAEMGIDAMVLPGVADHPLGAAAGLTAGTPCLSDDLVHFLDLRILNRSVGGPPGAAEQRSCAYNWLAGI
jgi:hypothetical protein